MNSYVNRLWFGLIVLAAFVFACLWFASPAKALSDSLGTVRVYTFSCTTTAAKIIPSSGVRSVKAQRFWNNSTSPVYIGGTDVDTSTKGWPICTDTAACEQASFPIDAGTTVWCKAGSTVSLLVFTGT